MTKPPSIARFEQFYWASVVVGWINTAVNWSTARAGFTANPMLVSYAWLLPLFQIIGLAITIALWFFIVRRPSVVAKWVQVVIAALSAFGVSSAVFFVMIGRAPFGLQVVLGAIATLFYIAAAVMLFRPDAKLWLGEGLDEDELIEEPRV